MRHFRAAAARAPRLVTDVPYVRIEPAARMVLTDDELKTIGLVPVLRRQDAILAAYSTDAELRTFGGRVASYGRQERKLPTLAKIESIGPWSRKDRSSARLLDLRIDPGESYTVDVLLLPAAGMVANRQALSALVNFVSGEEGHVLDRVLRRSFAAARVRVTGQSLERLLDYRDDIALVDLPPEVSVLVQSVLNLDLAATPEITAPEATAPAICIVDSGIVEGHPLLADAIISSKSRSFPESLGPPVPQPPVDKAGHGTHVSGVALYGDVGGRALAKEFSPELWLINARILDDENQLDPARMPFVGDIAEHARDRCRIFNLSFGFSAPGGFMSQYAVEMDEIARERDVLFVVSSGNRLPDHSSEKPYPEFLKDPAWSVLSPAEALNALTVGGITPDRDPYPHAHRKAMAPQALAFSLLALLRDQ